MAEGKKSFLLYTDLIAVVEKLPDEKAGQLFKTILAYVNDRSPELNDLILQIAFEPIRNQLKRDLQKYEIKKKQWSEAGKKSAENRKKTDKISTVVEGRSTVSTVNVNDTVNVNVNDTVFINIGTEKFLMKPSQLAITDGFSVRTEQTLMALNGINTTLLWEQFDKKYTYHDFDDRNHFFNALALVGEKILNPPVKGYGINTTAPTHIGELKRPL